MIYSYELEKKVLSGLLQHQHKWAEVSAFLKDNDFYFEDSKVNVSIFKLIRNALDNTEVIDETILVQRLNQLKVSFPDSIDIAEYVYSLAFYKITEEVFIASVRELKKFTVRREIYKSCKEVASFVKNTDPTLKYSEIIERSDQLYNKTIEGFETADKGPVNLFELMEPMIEERGNNPITQFGLMGPHPRINQLYGSLLRAGNATIVVARAKTGKTSFALDFATKVSAMHDNVPVLHFDNGEMSEEELIMRQMSAMTKLPLHLFETGKWRTSSYGGMSSSEIVELTRSTFKKIKGMKFYYENVAGLGPDEMVSAMKRFYYSQVGRGNPMIFSFDYIKSDFANMGQNADWLQVGYLMHRFKQCIQRELCFDGKPAVSMLTSVQANRAGITTNRGVDAIVDDESIVGKSDMLMHFCSHLFILRNKVAEELMADGPQFGTHKLINIAARHLGEDVGRAINKVVMPDGSHRNNFINLDFSNFSITEKGDLVDMLRAMGNNDVELEQDDGDTGVPMILRQ